MEILKDRVEMFQTEGKLLAPLLVMKCKRSGYRSLPEFLACGNIKSIHIFIKKNQMETETATPSNLKSK